MLCHILSGGACGQAFSTRNNRDVQATDLLGLLETRDEEENGWTSDEIDLIQNLNRTDPMLTLGTLRRMGQTD